MQLLFLHRRPELAALLHRNKRIVNKLIVECLQLVGGAIRHQGLGFDDDLVSKPHSPNHICAVWVRAHFLHFKWAVKHVDKLYKIYDKHIRKTPDGHTSSFKKIKYAKALVKSIESGRTKWPVNMSLDEFRIELETIFERQSKKAKENGPPLIASRGVPSGMLCAVVAVDKEWRERLGIRPSPKLNAVKVYRAYHEAKHELDEAPWHPDRK